MHATRSASFALLIMIFMGCNSNDSSPAADGGLENSDSSAISDSKIRDGIGPDSFAEDSSITPPDFGNPPSDGAVLVDIGTDLGIDALACSYMELDREVVLCAGAYKMIKRLVSNSGTCPPCWTMDAGATCFNDSVAAATAAGCDITCVWTFFQAVTFVHCGHKNGYEMLTAPSCDDLYLFADGYYPSFEAWAAEHPC